MDITTLEHVDSVVILVVSNREWIDILIGQSDKTLPTVLEELEGMLGACDLCHNFVDASTQLEMSSQLDFQLDPLEVDTPFL